GTSGSSSGPSGRDGFEGLAKSDGSRSFAERPRSLGAGSSPRAATGPYGRPRNIHRIAPTAGNRTITTIHKNLGRFRISCLGVVKASKNAYTHRTIVANVISPPSHSMSQAYPADASPTRGHRRGCSVSLPGVKCPSARLARFPEQQGAHLRFAETAMTAGGADTADPSRRGPTRHGLGIN